MKLDDNKTKRSNPQNRALWLFFDQLSESLNDAGYSQRDIFEKAKSFDAPCTKDSVHDIWMHFQRAMFKTDSTTKLTKSEGDIEEIHKVLMENLGRILELPYLPFPSTCGKCKHIECVCSEGEPPWRQ